MQKNLVLIFSEEFEYSTNQVLEWLTYYGQKFYRVNGEDKVECLKFAHDNTGIYFELLINNTDVIKSTDIKSFWYRRGNVEIKDIIVSPTSALSEAANKEIAYQLKNEIKTLNDLMYFYLENQIFSVGKRSNVMNNKLIHFEIARSLKVNTPDSYICSKKEQIMNIIKSNQNKGFVLKCISDGIMFDMDEQSPENKYTYGLYTETLSIEDVEDLPDNFSPSLLQERLEKRYELRIFYLHGEFYPMAIFSQSNPQTQVDFRHYDYKKPNRWIPYKLPTDFENKLRKLMKKLNLNTGSIDTIVTPQLDFYFLEVNPVGQFGMVSHPCNYKLEKKIAQLLINKRAEKLDFFNDSI